MNASSAAKPNTSVVVMGVAKAVIEIAGTPDEIVTSAIRALGLREVGAATPPTR